VGRDAEPGRDTAGAAYPSLTPGGPRRPMRALVEAGDQALDPGAVNRVGGIDGHQRSFLKRAR